MGDTAPYVIGALDAAGKMLAEQQATIKRLEGQVGDLARAYFAACAESWDRRETIERLQRRGEIAAKTLDDTEHPEAAALVREALESGDV
jgi:hypothetical protein